MQKSTKSDLSIGKKTLKKSRVCESYKADAGLHEIVGAGLNYES
jgi:hypothetical protein